MDNFFKKSEKREKQTLSLMLKKNTLFAGRCLHDFIISWQRNLSPCPVAEMTPELKVHIQ